MKTASSPSLSASSRRRDQASPTPCARTIKMVRFTVIFRPEYCFCHHSRATRDARKCSARLPTPTHLASGRRESAHPRRTRPQNTKAKGECSASSLASAQEPLASGRRRRLTTERRGRREERAVGVGCGGAAPVSVGSRLGPPGSRSSADAGHVAGPASKRARGDERPPQLEGMGLGLGCVHVTAVRGRRADGHSRWQWFDSQAHFVVVMAPTRNEPKVWENPLTSGLTH